MLLRMGERTAPDGAESASATSSESVSICISDQSSDSLLSEMTDLLYAPFACERKGVGFMTTIYRLEPRSNSCTALPALPCPKLLC